MVRAGAGVAGPAGLLIGLLLTGAAPLRAAEPPEAKPTHATPPVAPAPSPPSGQGGPLDDLMEMEPTTPPHASAAVEDLASVWALMLKSALALLAVVFAIYIIVGKGMGRLASRPVGGQRLKVVERVGLDPKRTVFLLEVDGARALMATADNAVTVAFLPEPPRRSFDEVRRGQAADRAAADEPLPKAANGAAGEGA